MIIKQIMDKWFCLHKWELKDEIAKRSKSNIIIGYVQIRICTNCGKIHNLLIK